MNKLHKHALYVEYYGGPSKLAKKMGFEVKHSGANASQRFRNWTVRGIPALQLLKNRKLFSDKLLEKLISDAKNEGRTDLRLD
jgi:hypothetical protein